MRRLEALAALLVLAAAGWSIPAVATGGEPQVTDPAGDAALRRGDLAYSLGRSNYCGLGQTHATCHGARGVAMDALRAARPTTSKAGTEAPPTLDGTAVRFEETPTEFLVTLELASLDGAFTGAITADNSRWASYSVSWDRRPDTECLQLVEALVHPGDAGPVLEPRYDRVYDTCPTANTDEAEYEAACNNWWTCEWRVPVELDYGAPGAIRWRIPRELMLGAEAGDAFHHPRFTIVVREDAVTAVDENSGYDLRAASQEFTQRVWANRNGYVVDDSEKGRPFTFIHPAPPGAPIPQAAVLSPDAAGDAWQSDPLSDILSIGVDDTPESVVFEITLATVPEEPHGQMGTYFAWATPSGRVYTAVAMERNGEWMGWGAYGAGKFQTEHLIRIPLAVEAEPGSPGKLRVSFDRGDLDPIGRGDLFAFTDWWEVWPPGAAVEPVPHEVDTPAAYAHVVVPPRGSSGGLDYTVPLPYRARFDTDPALAAARVLVLDETGDTRLPNAAASANAAQFDISYVAARGGKGEVFDLALGVRDLASLAVPPLYDAIFYGFGVRTDAGDAMVGYYKEKRDPAGAFFCAPDVTILAKQARDPTAAIWTLIEGRVDVAGADGGPRPGTLTFHVPASCVDADAREAVQLERLEAATFVVQNPTGELGGGTVHRTDDVAAEGPVSLPLEVASAQLARAAWYEAPLGVDHFWDIIGVLAAVVVGTGGLVVRLRHRRVDRAALADARSREARETYRAALARALGTSEGRDVYDDPVLRALRERFRISEREHAAMELEVRAGAGGLAALTVGQRFLGKYRILRGLGEGGFARTFLARDEKLERDVVLKVARWDSAREGKRALREARSLARLRHPRIVSIHDAEEVGGSVVLVLEFMPAGSLADRLARGPLPVADAVRLADDVLAALEAAHAAGVVHRDVKPANVLLDIDGRAKLADFGISTTPAGSGTATGISLDGAGAGTLGYMAPEQARGADPDERSDLFSVGAMLYEMLAGRPYLDLARLPEFEARRAIVEEPADLPLEAAPPALNALLASALAKDPAGRPQTAAQMRRLLQAAPR